MRFFNEHRQRLVNLLPQDMRPSETRSSTGALISILIDLLAYEAERIEQEMEHAMCHHDLQEDNLEKFWKVVESARKLGCGIVLTHHAGHVHVQAYAEGQTHALILSGNVGHEQAYAYLDRHGRRFLGEHNLGSVAENTDAWRAAVRVSRQRLSRLGIGVERDLHCAWIQRVPVDAAKWVV